MPKAVDLLVEQHPCWVSDQGSTKVMVKLHRGGFIAIYDWSVGLVVLLYHSVTVAGLNFSFWH